MQTLDSDVISGREVIAKIVGMTPEGVTWLWSQGRLPVLRVGSAYLANRRALEAAVASGIRRPPGRKPKPKMETA
jgi:hypothetical protein